MLYQDSFCFYWNSNNVLATLNTKTFSISICRPTANAFVTKNMSILNIDDHCLEVTPRDNSAVEKDRYLYRFSNNQ